MNEYDNTNRGALFKPHDGDQLVGQGKININGQDYQTVLVKQSISRSGRVERVLYIRAAVMWGKDRDAADATPDYSGDIELFPPMRAAGWVEKKDGKPPYISVKVSKKLPKDDGYNQSSDDPGAYRPDLDDDIPF